MRIPPSLKPGATIGITAPSFGATIEPYKTRFAEAIRLFRSRGYKVIIGETCSKSDGLGISTKPSVAAKELQDFYLNPDIQAIISCGGGELMCETVGCLNFEAIRQAPPKWFMGYSDNTNFIHPLVTLCDTAAIYGTTITGFGKPWEQPETAAVALLEGTSSTVHGYPLFQLLEAGTEAKEANPLSRYILTEKKKLRTYLPDSNGLRPAKKTERIRLEGLLLGGCLDVLNNLAGTKLDNQKTFNSHSGDIIWVLEACDYNPMDIRRALWHLDSCGWFESAKGFVIGRPLAAWQQEMMGVDQYNAVTDILGRHNIPIVMDADVGHISPAMPLVMGSKASVRVKGNSIEVTMDVSSTVKQ